MLHQTGAAEGGHGFSRVFANAARQRSRLHLRSRAECSALDIVPAGSTKPTQSTGRPLRRLHLPCPLALLIIIRASRRAGGRRNGGAEQRGSAICRAQRVFSHIALFATPRFKEAQRFSAPWPRKRYTTAQSHSKLHLDLDCLRLYADSCTLLPATMPAET